MKRERVVEGEEKRWEQRRQRLDKKKKAAQRNDWEAARQGGKDRL